MDDDLREASLRHPHEPEIAPSFDDEGRCRVCALLVERKALQGEYEEMKRQRDQYRDSLRRLAELGRRLFEASDA